MRQLSIEDARKLLMVAGVFFSSDEEEDGYQTLNMNDVWCWACAWGEPVSDEELPEVARLFIQYGEAGLLYWVSERHDQMRSEFEDNNRFIDFVRNEERIRREEPDWDKRGYYKSSYTLGLSSEDK